MTFRAAALAALLALGTALAGGPASAAGLTADEALTLAKAVTGELGAGSIDRTKLAPALSSDLNDAALAQDVRIFHGRDTPKRFIQRSRGGAAGTTVYVYQLDWPEGSISMTMGVDDATSLITTLYFRPGIVAP